MWSRFALCGVVAAGLLVTAGSAYGEEEEKLDPFGEVHIHVNVAYVKVTVNDVAWDSVEYGSSGKVAIVRGLRMENGPFRVLVEDSQGLHESAEFTVEAKAFKRRVKKRILSMVATKKLRLKKKQQDAKPAEPEPEEPKGPTPGDSPDDGDDL